MAYEGHGYKKSKRLETLFGYIKSDISRVQRMHLSHLLQRAMLIIPTQTTAYFLLDLLSNITVNAIVPLRNAVACDQRLPP